MNTTQKKFSVNCGASKTRFLPICLAVTTVLQFLVGCAYRAHLKSGNAALERGNFNQAIQEFTQAIPEATAGAEVAYGNRGLALVARGQEGDAQRAVADFSKIQG